MRYKIIDVYQKENLKHYIAKSLKPRSPQFIIIQSPQTLCLNLDIIDVNPKTAVTTWATGEEIAMKILRQFDSFDKAYLA
ncbi:hypothetical protein [Acinetobacter pragensis]|uniref:hypothetical protein n=1 Tax=Acinetobacter pragensis TaxID=1806892 RepID=UPI0033400C1A